MTNRAAEASPQPYARIGGILYLFIVKGPAPSSYSTAKTTLPLWRSSPKRRNPSGTSLSL